VPPWARGAVFYQIFPGRFREGGLRGIADKLPYLADLGVDALYLNPIFEAESDHRYDTTDYHRIDPRLGDLDDFHALLSNAHDRGLRVVLDGVFNHCGRAFFAFADLLENGAASPYRDWFTVNRFPVDAFSPGPARDYHAWWNLKSLPKLNVRNPETRAYLLDVARRWIEEGADGWRLDVPDEVGDASFWVEFRDVVRAANPEAYLLGEVWAPDPAWVGPGRFDGLMHYSWRAAVLDLLTAEEPDVERFADRVEALLDVFPDDHAHAMYLPLGTHDTPRIVTELGGDLRKVELAFRLLLAWPGAPGIYYGDEIGLPGGPDPDCRRPFPWDPDPRENPLRETVKRMIATRRASPALRRGTYRRVEATDGSYAFTRTLEDDRVLVIANVSATERTVSLPGGEHLTLAPFQAVWRT
jgi:glycosidase